MPKVSIIVPVYNKAKYVSKAVDSLLNQQLRDIEIILVDDGSSDASPEFLDEYADKDDRVKVIHQVNQGVSAARNTGLALATGDYIGFMDPDDWVESDMFDALLTAAAKEDADVVMCNFRKEDVDGNLLEAGNEPIFDVSGEIRAEIRRKLLTNEMFTSSCDKIYRRTLFGKCRLAFPTDIRTREDYFFNLDVFDCADRVFYLPKPYYHYQDIANSASKKYHQGMDTFAEKLYAHKMKYATKWKRDSADILDSIALEFLFDIQGVVVGVCDYGNDDSLGGKYGKIRTIIGRPLVKECLQRYKSRGLKSRVGRGVALKLALMERNAALPLLLISRARRLKYDMDNKQ